MKKEFLQQAYEAPEVETIEVRMERSILSGDCPGVDSEGICLQDDDECESDYI